jgi:Enoyl-CoA hydratase/isomerase
MCVHTCESSYRQFWFFATQEDPVNADVLTTRVADGIAVITLGSARRIYFDEEMGDALTEALDRFAGDANVRVVVVTGGAPGYFIRHFTVAALIRLAESLRASGREWPENATYNGGFFDKAMALCESMSKPVIAAISGTCLAGGLHRHARLRADCGRQCCRCGAQSEDRRSSVHRLVSHSGIFAGCLGQPFLPFVRFRQVGDHGGRPPGRRDNRPVAPRSRATGCAGNRWRFM